MSEAIVEPQSNWFSREDLEQMRDRIPMVYVDLVPVRADDSGKVTEVGLLYRVTGEGMITRALVTGRVLYGERIRDAIVRHIEKDLGPLALPRVPMSPQPFTVAEYFPTLGVTPFYDPRQHAVSLAYVVQVMGDPAPQQDALSLTWFPPEEAVSEGVLAEMAGGQDTLLRMAMAHVGVLP